MLGYNCALQKDILLQGKMYLSERHIAFYSNIFGWVTNVCCCDDRCHPPPLNAFSSVPFSLCS